MNENSTNSGAGANLKIAVVLLAAGLSTRMGEMNKLLIAFEGEPLVRRTARVYLAVGADVFVVLGYEARAVQAALAGLSLTFVVNPNYAEGQATSARAGVDAVPAGYDAVMVALADQPALMPADIKDMLRAFAKTDRSLILIPYYGDRRGNPVMFPAGLIAEMRSSGSNIACRKFIDANPQLTKRYVAPNDHFVIDVDTPEDVQAFGASDRR